MPHFDKHYTLEEANRLIPRMRRVFDLAHRLLRGQPVYGPGQAIGDDGMPPHFADSASRSVAPPSSESERQTAVRALLEEELFRRGIVLQDIWRGLIDFPCLLPSGEEILLCYELDDGPCIVAFHPLDSGYAGRRPIEDLEGA